MEMKNQKRICLMMNNNFDLNSNLKLILNFKLQLNQSKYKRLKIKFSKTS